MAKGAGTHTAKITPDANHQWDSGTNPTDSRTIQFVIAKAIPPDVVFPTPAAVTYDSTQTLSQINLFGSGDGIFKW